MPATQKPLYLKVHPDPLDISTPENRRAAAAHFHREGYAVLQVLSEDECDDLIIEQWLRIIDRQGVRPELRIEHPDPVTNRNGFLAFAKQPLNGPTRKAWESAWTLHALFGACCDNASFHSQRIWNVRQDPRLYEFAAAVLGRQDLWVDVNRSYQKLPGKGEEEFLHYDIDPLVGADFVDGVVDKVCGKLGYTSFSTILARRTHTSAFQERFREQYGPIYNPDGRRRAGCKFGLDISKPDPANLFGSASTGVESSWCHEVVVPPGCWLVWDERILHGTTRNMDPSLGRGKQLRVPVQYGMYLGYFGAESRDKYHRLAGMEERMDRVECFKEGRAPVLWPSMDRIYYVPKKYYNFPHLMNSRLAKLDPGNGTIRRKRMADGTEKVDFVPEPMPAGERAIALSDLGKRLVGEKSWGEDA